MPGAGAHARFDVARQVGLQQRPQARAVQHFNRLLLGSAAAVAFDPAFGQQYATLGAGQARGRTQFVHCGGADAVGQAMLA
jgi:hypothetical protein